MAKKKAKTSSGLGSAIVIGLLLAFLIPKISASAGTPKNCHGSKVAVEQCFAEHVFHNNHAQQNCLISLWNGESGWNAFALNTTGPDPSYAYGIPQILPSAHGHPVAMGDWKAQIIWGYHYIKGRYGTACNAYYRWLNRNPHWY